MLDASQRRTLITLACKVAWADGVVTPEERAAVLRLVERFGHEALTQGELDRWLESGAPDAELATLPDDVGEQFFFEAMDIMRADGDVAPEEMEVVCELMSRVFDTRPKGTPLARIKLVRRPA